MPNLANSDDCNPPVIPTLPLKPHGLYRRHHKSLARRMLRMPSRLARQDAPEIPDDETDDAQLETDEPQSATTASISEQQNSTTSMFSDTATATTANATLTSTTSIEPSTTPEPSSKSEELLSDLFSVLSAIEQESQAFAVVPQSTSVMSSVSASPFPQMPSGWTSPEQTMPMTKMIVLASSSSSVPASSSSSVLTAVRVAATTSTSAHLSITSSTTTSARIAAETSVKPQHDDNQDAENNAMTRGSILVTFFGVFAACLLAIFLFTRYRLYRDKKRAEADAVSWMFCKPEDNYFAAKDDKLPNASQAGAAFVILNDGDSIDSQSTVSRKRPDESLLHSRFSASTTGSIYSSASTPRGSTASDYWIDPRYSGPNEAPMMPPALYSSTSEIRPARPSRADGAPLLTPQEFFSLPSSDSLHAAYAQGAPPSPTHARRSSEPVSGYTASDDGLLSVDREPGMSRASQQMASVLAVGGLSGLKRRATQRSSNSRRSHSLSVLVDFYTGRASTGSTITASSSKGE